jgi:hypothetical protein
MPGCRQWSGSGAEPWCRRLPPTVPGALLRLRPCCPWRIVRHGQGRRRWLSIAAIASSNSAGLPQFSVGSRWAHHTTPPTARGTDQIRQPGCRRPACRARRRTGRTELAKPEQSDHVSVPRAHELPSERVTADLRARITTREWQPGEASADCERARGQVQRQPGDRGEGGPRSGGRGLAGYAGAVGDVRSACTLGGLA